MLGACNDENICGKIDEPEGRKRKIPQKHKLTKEEAIDWVKKKMNVQVEYGTLSIATS